MATSVHIPKPILDEVDRRARRLSVSRNRFIVQALERELSSDGSWSPGFFEKFTPLAPAAASALDATMAEVVARRRSKRAPRL